MAPEICSAITCSFLIILRPGLLAGYACHLRFTPIVDHQQESPLSTNCVGDPVKSDVRGFWVMRRSGARSAKSQSGQLLRAQRLDGGRSAASAPGLWAGTDLFHRNVRWFLHELFPGLSFDEQLRRVWLTEGRLCSIAKEIGSSTIFSRSLTSSPMM
jgi:hypothetical protein